ncbi:MAG TPA: CcmD family protein [Ktedonobacterales bacterium]|nr:CcmD family protein [Ktedonobacterales bacterium]
MGFVVATYAIIWLVVFGYLGWIALRLRGAQSELGAVEEQLRERDRPGA